MPAAERIGDSYNDGDHQAVGSGNVFVNGIPFARLSDSTTGHGCFPPANVSSASGNVFVNNRGAARLGDSHSVHCCLPPGSPCHDAQFVAGSPDVYVNNAVSGAQPHITFEDAVMQLQDEEVETRPLPATDPRQINKNAAYKQAFGSGFNFNNSPPPVLDTNPAVKQTAMIPSDCADIFTHEGPFLGNFMLSENFDLAHLSTNTFVSNYRVVAQGGLTEMDIICNLRKLCVNVLEPLLKLYGHMQINSGFRTIGNGATASQHFKGQAADVTFTNLITADDFNARAIEIKNTALYDQMIFEQNRPQRSSTWFHLSYVDAKRGQVLTKKAMSNQYLPGLYKLSFTAGT